MLATTITAGPSRMSTVARRTPAGAMVSVPRMTSSRIPRAFYTDLSRSAFSTSTRTTSIPLNSLSALRFRQAVRYASTETARSSTSISPPPLGTAPTTVGSETDLAKVPPPGSPPPLPPVPLNAIPPNVAGQAEEAVSKEVAKKDKKPKGTMPQRAWATVKKEAAHYWAGTKLLGHEIKISAKLIRVVLRGETLTRRERRQLRRTTNDLLRLIPFSVFLVVPFMELLLPVALKLFPNMLPSTFEGQFAADEKQRKLLRVRIEMAKFLQEGVKEDGLKAGSVVKSEEFKEFFRKVRSTGETPSHNDVIRVAKLFNDDISLDNLSRPQLVSMCRYMNINAWGTDNFLKQHIRNKLEKVRVDDMMIFAEGVDSLSTKELQSACQSRGIRFSGVSPARLREELEQWIELHYTNGISGVLLILSRAFNFEQKGDDVMNSLVITLGSLPENLVDEAELNVSDESSYKQKLEVIQQQQELIEDEEKQEMEEQEARKEKKEAEEAAKQREKEDKEALAASSEASTASAAAPAIAEVAETEDARMTKEQLGELAEALSILTAKSSIVKERDELKELLQDNLLSEAESKQREEEPDSPSIAVSKRVRSMIKKIDAQLEKYDEKVGSSLNVIETNAKGQISLADLKRAMAVIKHAPKEADVEALGKKLDVDQDGFVELNHVVELTRDHGLGILMDDEAAQTLLSKGADIKNSKDLKEVKDLKPKREDIISDA